jgi:twinkle protein
MISGSQHWWNKADCALTVWRDSEYPDSQEVDIHIQKVRFKHIGRPGMVTLRYDRVTGRYHEMSQRGFS